MANLNVMSSDRSSIRRWGKDAHEMRESRRAKYFIGPDGNVVTIADLPSPKTTRWVIRRKAEVVLAVQVGMITLQDACERYRLTLEEFVSWQNAIQRHGILALRTTQLQRYRHGEDEPGAAKSRNRPPTLADRFVFAADDVA